MQNIFTTYWKHFSLSVLLWSLLIISQRTCYFASTQLRCLHSSDRMFLLHVLFLQQKIQETFLHLRVLECQDLARRGSWTLHCNSANNFSIIQSFWNQIPCLESQSICFVACLVHDTDQTPNRHCKSLRCCLWVYHIHDANHQKKLNN